MSNHKAPEAIRAHMRRVGLSVPIMACGEVVQEVFLRKPTARYLSEHETFSDIGAADQIELKYMMVRLATGLSREEVLDIDMSDFDLILDEVADFFGDTASQEPTPNGGAA